MTSLQVVESSSRRGETELGGAPRRLEDSKTRRLVAWLSFVVILGYGCRTTAPVPQPIPEALHGVASWYGEEFAGRTTANGEIFDPATLTAAHRTLPFGTVLDVTNARTKQTVRVRVNDRGPYIGGRILDLSYAAAQRIGLIEPGIGEVDIAVVRVGSGDREPPVPFEATIAEAPNTVPIIAPSDAPKVEIPIPAPPAPAPAPAPVQPVVVDQVEVQVQRGDVITRTQVAPDGKTLEEVPVGTAPATAKRPAVQRNANKPHFIVQVGAFAVEANAKSLQERLTSIGQRAWIDRDTLYRVRLGPFATRDQAAAARASLEANGLSAIILSE